MVISNTIKRRTKLKSTTPSRKLSKRLASKRTNLKMKNKRNSLRSRRLYRSTPPPSSPRGSPRIWWMVGKKIRRTSIRSMSRTLNTTQWSTNWMEMSALWTSILSKWSSFWDRKKWRQKFCLINTLWSRLFASKSTWKIERSPKRLRGSLSMETNVNTWTSWRWKWRGLSTCSNPTSEPGLSRLKNICFSWLKKIRRTSCQRPRWSTLGTCMSRKRSTFKLSCSTGSARNWTAWRRDKISRIKWVSNFKSYAFITLIFLYPVTKPNTKQFVFVRFLESKQKMTIMGHIDIQIKEDNIYYLPFDQVKSMME